MSILCGLIAMCSCVFVRDNGSSGLCDYPSRMRECATGTKAIIHWSHRHSMAQGCLSKGDVKLDAAFQREDWQWQIAKCLV